MSEKIQRNYFTIDEDKIYLKKYSENNSIFYSSKATLRNITDKFLLVKVYVNKQKVYSTNPSTCYMEPQGSILINIRRQDFTEDNNVKEDIFMFSAYISDVEVKDVSILLYFR